MDRIIQTYTDLKSADVIGRYLGAAPNHLVRLIKLFLPEERKKLLQHAFQFYKTIDSRGYTIEQFIAFNLLALINGVDYDERQITLLSRGLTPVKAESSRGVRLGRLNSDSLALVRTVLAGEDPIGLAEVLSNTVIGELTYFEEDVIRVLTDVFEEPIARPELAAGVARCLSFNRRLTQTYKADAALLTACARLIPDCEFDDVDLASSGHLDSTGSVVFDEEVAETTRRIESNEYDRKKFNDLIETVDWRRTSSALQNLEAMQVGLGNKLDLATKFGFVESPYGVLVPIRQAELLSNDFLKLVERAKKDKSTLLTLSPRGFEQFTADLFRAMGYAVELTKATRDGGADLVCLRNLNGIPFRFAVEVKRYKDTRPITVGLVRSFVGANEQFRADKLIYLTTSYYTRSALEFAEKYASHVLALKNYEQMREWFDEVGKETWKLLG